MARPSFFSTRLPSVPVIGSADAEDTAVRSPSRQTIILCTCRTIGSSLAAQAATALYQCRPTSTNSMWAQTALASLFSMTRLIQAHLHLRRGKREDMTRMDRFRPEARRARRVAAPATGLTASAAAGAGCERFFSAGAAASPVRATRVDQGNCVHCRHFCSRRHSSSLSCDGLVGPGVAGRRRQRLRRGDAVRGAARGLH